MLKQPKAARMVSESPKHVATAGEVISASIKKIKKIQDKCLSLTGPREQEYEEFDGKHILNFQNGIDPAVAAAIITAPTKSLKQQNPQALKTMRINPSNKRKQVVNAVSKLLDENRQKHITIEGEERDFNGVCSDSSDQVLSMSSQAQKMLDQRKLISQEYIKAPLIAGERNHSIDKISEISREQLATVEDNNRGETSTTAPSKSLITLDQQIAMIQNN